MNFSKIITVSALTFTLSTGIFSQTIDNPYYNYRVERQNNFNQIILEKFDTDKDGIISDSERELMRSQRQTDMQNRLLEKYDTDKDGILSEAELEIAKANRPNFKNGRMNQLNLKYDADGDGILSDTEKQTMRIDKQQSMLSKFDTDGDGIISETERQTMRSQRQTNRQNYSQYQNSENCTGEGINNPNRGQGKGRKGGGRKGKGRK